MTAAQPGRPPMPSNWQPNWGDDEYRWCPADEEAALVDQISDGLGGSSAKLRGGDGGGHVPTGEPVAAAESILEADASVVRTWLMLGVVFGSMTAWAWWLAARAAT